MEKKQSGLWNKVCILSGFSLKIIAAVSMTIDHAGAVLLPGCIWMRILGRIAFPIYCFLLVKGFRNTRNINKYIGRMLIFAVVSEIPFDLAFYGKIYYIEYQNVFFTLFLGLLMMEIVTLLRTYGKTDSYILNGILEGLVVLSTALTAEILKTDYSFYGILMIYVFFLFENHMFMAVLFQAYINIKLMGYIQGYALLAMLPVCLYNGSRGRMTDSKGIFSRKKMKFFFYWYYPIHLLVLWLISNRM